jgi:hypothetical protein
MPPNEGRKKDGWPNDRGVEPVDVLVSHAPRHTIHPPTGGTQQIVSLPYSDIHMFLLIQPRFHDYPKINDQHRAM